MGRVRSRAGRPTNSVKATGTPAVKIISDWLTMPFYPWTPKIETVFTREMYEEAKADLLKAQDRYNEIKWGGGFE
jgi:hypothetical protein